MNHSSYLVGAFAVFCYALLPVVAKKIQINVPPFAFMAITMGVLMALAIIASLSFEKGFSISQTSTATWLGLALFAVVNFAAFACYLHAINGMPITIYQLIGLVTPIIGGVLAYFILGEEFKLRYLIGLAIIGIGLFVALYERESGTQ